MSRKRIVTEHGRLLETQDLKTRVFFRLLNCNRAVNIILGSCISPVQLAAVSGDGATGRKQIVRGECFFGVSLWHVVVR